MTSLTDRLRQHAQLHQQCTVQDAEQLMFSDDLLAAAAEIDQLTLDLQTEWDAVVALKAQVRVLREALGNEYLRGYKDGWGAT